MTSLTQTTTTKRFKQKIFVLFESVMPITVSWKAAQTAQLNPHSNDAVTQKENLMANWVNKAKLAKPKGQHAHEHLLHLTGHILKPSLVFPIRQHTPANCNKTSHSCKQHFLYCSQNIYYTKEEKEVPRVTEKLDNKIWRNEKWLLRHTLKK